MSTDLFPDPFRPHRSHRDRPHREQFTRSAHDVTDHAHQTSHQSGGGDELDHGTLAGRADDDHVFYPKGELGYAQVTANQTGITSETALTGLTATVTVEADRRIQIVGSANLLIQTAGDALIGRIKTGTTVLGTFARKRSSSGGHNNDQQTYERSIVVTPTAGEHTYHLTLENNVGTGGVDLRASSTEPAFILVEDIGPA